MLIELKNISKKYNDKIIFEQANFSIENGEMSAIIGQSGTGKTTLINILSGCDTNFSGQYYFNNELLENKNIHAKLKNKVSFVLQEIGVLDYLTGEENILLPFNYSKRKVNLEYLKYICKLLNINNILNKKTKYLSGGEKQRIAIARALITKPEILLADEPTGALDDINTFNTINLLSDINKNLKTTILVVTHRKDILKFFNKVYEIENKKTNVV